ncbi:MAG: hypothetical protein ACYC5G_02690 [Candidatus Doudnabacteria bacterium]
MILIFATAGFILAFAINVFWNHGANLAVKMFLSLTYAFTGYFTSWMVSALLFAKSRGIDFVGVLMDHSRDAEVTYTAVGVWTVQVLFAHLVFKWIERTAHNIQ